MDRRLILTVVALAATLVAVAFIVVETFKGVVAYTMRELENCTPPCVVGPPPPEPLERQVAKWLLVAAVAVFEIVLIKSIGW
jgi:hypothetical protein